MKTVVHVWSHTIPQPIGMGIGDFLRGTMRLYQLSKIHGFDLVVDTDFHRLSCFLEKTPHPYKEHLKKIDFVYLEHLDNFLEKHKDTDLIMISTNEALDESRITDDCLNFMMQKVLIPNAEFLALYDERRKKIPFKNFQVVHFRLGDDHLVNRTPSTGYLENLAIKALQDISRCGPTVVLSDSPFLRETIAAKSIHNVVSFTDDIGHVGTIASPMEALFNTFFEYRLLCEAKQILAFSKYRWISGFVYYPHLIYKIPLARILSLNPIKLEKPEVQLHWLKPKTACS